MLCAALRRNGFPYPCALMEAGEKPARGLNAAPWTQQVCLSAHHPWFLSL